ncbi:MAG: hypothetical protein R3F23_02430 [Verrucomicrobiia bacterium]
MPKTPKPTIKALKKRDVNKGNLPDIVKLSVTGNRSKLAASKLIAELDPELKGVARKMQYEHHMDGLRHDTQRLRGAEAELTRIDEAIAIAERKVTEAKDTSGGNVAEAEHALKELRTERLGTERELRNARIKLRDRKKNTEPWLTEVRSELDPNDLSTINGLIREADAFGTTENVVKLSVGPNAKTKEAREFIRKLPDGERKHARRLQTDHYLPYLREAIDERNNASQRLESATNRVETAKKTVAATQPEGGTSHTNAVQELTDAESALKDAQKQLQGATATLRQRQGYTETWLEEARTDLEQADREALDATLQGASRPPSNIDSRLQQALDRRDTDFLLVVDAINKKQAAEEALRVAEASENMGAINEAHGNVAEAIGDLQKAEKSLHKNQAAVNRANTVSSGAPGGNAPKPVPKTEAEAAYQIAFYNEARADRERAAQALAAAKKRKTDLESAQDHSAEALASADQEILSAQTDFNRINAVYHARSRTATDWLKEAREAGNLDKTHLKPLDDALTEGQNFDARLGAAKEKPTPEVAAVPTTEIPPPPKPRDSLVPLGFEEDSLVLAVTRDRNMRPALQRLKDAYLDLRSARKELKDATERAAEARDAAKTSPSPANAQARDAAVAEMRAKSEAVETANTKVTSAYQSYHAICKKNGVDKSLANDVWGKVKDEVKAAERVTPAQIQKAADFLKEKGVTNQALAAAIARRQQDLLKCRRATDEHNQAKTHLQEAQKALSQETDNPVKQEAVKNALDQLDAKKRAYDDARNAYDLSSRHYDNIANRNDGADKVVADQVWEKIKEDTKTYKTNESIDALNLDKARDLLTSHDITDDKVAHDLAKAEALYKINKDAQQAAKEAADARNKVLTEVGGNTDNEAYKEAAALAETLATEAKAARTDYDGAYANYKASCKTRHIPKDKATEIWKEIREEVKNEVKYDPEKLAQLERERNEAWDALQTAKAVEKNAPLAEKSAAAAALREARVQYEAKYQAHYKAHRAALQKVGGGAAALAVLVGSEGCFAQAEETLEEFGIEDVNVTLALVERKEASDALEEARRANAAAIKQINETRVAWDANPQDTEKLAAFQAAQVNYEAQKEALTKTEADYDQANRAFQAACKQNEIEPEVARVIELRFLSKYYFPEELALAKAAKNRAFGEWSNAFEITKARGKQLTELIRAGAPEETILEAQGKYREAYLTAIEKTQNYLPIRERYLRMAKVMQEPKAKNQQELTKSESTRPNGLGIEPEDEYKDIIKETRALAQYTDAEARKAGEERARFEKEMRDSGVGPEAITSYGKVVKAQEEAQKAAKDASDLSVKMRVAAKRRKDLGEWVDEYSGNPAEETGVLVDLYVDMKGELATAAGTDPTDASGFTLDFLGLGEKISNALDLPDNLELAGQLYREAKSTIEEINSGDAKRTLVATYNFKTEMGIRAQDEDAAMFSNKLHSAPVTIPTIPDPKASSTEQQPPRDQRVAQTTQKPKELGNATSKQAAWKQAEEIPASQNVTRNVWESPDMNYCDATYENATIVEQSIEPNTTPTPKASVPTC